MSSYFTKQDYIDYIKLQLTGGLLELEIEDEVIGKFIDSALIELRRYYDVPVYITVPYARAIDLKGFDHSAITNVFRSAALNGDNIDSSSNNSSINISINGNGMQNIAQNGYNQSNWTFDTHTYPADPMYAQQWATFFGSGQTYNLQNYAMNYLSYSTLQQMQNTMSTDLTYIEDKAADKLYINSASSIPAAVTLEYIPVLKSVEQITDDYWIDILRRLATALVKIALGRVRTRFTQSNALWAQDGETMLTEGNEELKELRETLRVNNNMFILRD